MFHYGKVQWTQELKITRGGYNGQCMVYTLKEQIPNPHPNNLLD